MSLRYTDKINNSNAINVILHLLTDEFLPNILCQFMEKKADMNARNANINLLKLQASRYISHLYMKRRKNTNAMFVIMFVLPIGFLDNMLQQFIKKTNHSNVANVIV